MVVTSAWREVKEPQDTFVSILNVSLKRIDIVSILLNEKSTTWRPSTYMKSCANDPINLTAVPGDGW